MPNTLTHSFYDIKGGIKYIRQCWEVQRQDELSDDMEIQWMKFGRRRREKREAKEKEPDLLKRE